LAQDKKNEGPLFCTSADAKDHAVTKIFFPLKMQKKTVPCSFCTMIGYILLSIHPTNIVAKKHPNAIKFRCREELPAGIASAKKVVLQKENLEAALFLEMPWDRKVGVDQPGLEELS